MTVVMSESELLPWQRRHNGLTWRDMPCADEENKKIHFALFRRGLYQPGSAPNFAGSAFKTKPDSADTRARSLTAKAWIKERLANGERLQAITSSLGLYFPVVAAVLRNESRYFTAKSLARIEAAMGGAEEA